MEYESESEEEQEEESNAGHQTAAQQKQSKGGIFSLFKYAIFFTKLRVHE